MESVTVLRLYPGPNVAARLAGSTRLTLVGSEISSKVTNIGYRSRGRTRVSLILGKRSKTRVYSVGCSLFRGGLAKTSIAVASEYPFSKTNRYFCGSISRTTASPFRSPPPCQPPLSPILNQRGGISQFTSVTELAVLMPEGFVISIVSF